MLEMFQKFCEPVAWTEQQIEAVKEKGEINDAFQNFDRDIKSEKEIAGKVGKSVRVVL